MIKNFWCFYASQCSSAMGQIPRSTERISCFIFGCNRTGFWHFRFFVWFTGNGSHLVLYKIIATVLILVHPSHHRLLVLPSGINCLFLGIIYTSLFHQSKVAINIKKKKNITHTDTHKRTHTLHKHKELTDYAKLPTVHVVKQYMIDPLTQTLDTQSKQHCLTKPASVNIAVFL